MSEPAAITIVIPVLNRAEIVGRTLQSVAAQTLRPLSVVLVDNGSTDNTLEVLLEWQKRMAGDVDVTVVTESKPGAAAARNAGLQEVGSEWTMFFDSDDTMEADHCRRALEASGGHDIVGWDIEVVRDGLRTVKPFYCHDAQYHNLFHGSMSTQRYMAKTEQFRRVGGWNESVLYWDDIELGARLLNASDNIAKIKGLPTVKVYPGEDSISGPLYSLRTERAEHAMDIMACTLGPSGPRWTALKSAILAADCTREGSAEGRKIIRNLISRERSAVQRLLLRAVYAYRRMGGRGIARLIRPLV